MLWVVRTSSVSSSTTSASSSALIISLLCVICSQLSAHHFKSVKLFHGAISTLGVWRITTSTWLERTVKVLLKYVKHNGRQRCELWLTDEPLKSMWPKPLGLPVSLSMASLTAEQIKWRVEKVKCSCSVKGGGILYSGSDSRWRDARGSVDRWVEWITLVE